MSSPVTVERCQQDKEKILGDNFSSKIKTGFEKEEESMPGQKAAVVYTSLAWG